MGWILQFPNCLNAKVLVILLTQPRSILTLDLPSVEMDKIPIGSNPSLSIAL